MNRNKKTIIAIIVAVLFICAVVLTLVMAGVIPSSNEVKPGELITVTEAVTNEQGEAVTNAQGEVVTEIAEAEVVTEAGGEVVTEVVTNSSNQPYTQKNGSNVTRAVTKKKTTTKKTTTKKTNTTSKKSESTTAKGDNTTDKGNTTKPEEVATQAKKPGNITGLKVSEVKKDSITVTWNKLDCDKYQIRFGIGEELGEPQDITSTACTLDKLTSYTEYTIQVRGLNNSPGSSKGIAGEWATIRQRTEPNNESRKIKINYTLPVGSTSGEIEIYVKRDGDKKYPEKPDSTVKINKSSGTVETEDKYKGLVSVMIKYKNRSAESTLTDKDEVSIEIRDVNIGIANGEDD